MRMHLRHPAHRALRSGVLRLWRTMTGPRADRRQNRRLDPDGQRILFLRMYHPQGTCHDWFLEWLWRHRPALAARCELRRVGWRPGSLERVSLLVPLVQDPLRELHPRAFAQVQQLQEACDQRGIPVLNRVERLSVSRKTSALAVLRDCGLRCPELVPVRNHRELEAAAERFGFPCILRDDLRHGELSLIRSRSELARLRLRGRDQVLAAFIDSADEAGIYRKYRCFLLGGQRCVPRELMHSRDPLVREDTRLFTPELRAQESAYLAGEDPNHSRLDAARRAMGLDVVAFDYSYDREGQLLVWEPNPLAVSWDRHCEADRDRLAHELPAVHRLHLALAGFYAERAGLQHLLPSPQAETQSSGGDPLSRQ